MNLSEITASLLAILTTIGYFLVLKGIMMGMPEPGPARDLMNQMLGSLTTVWIMVMSYYYSGSTSSGKRGTGGGDVTIAGGNSPNTTHTAVLVDRQPMEKKQESGTNQGMGGESK